MLPYSCLFDPCQASQLCQTDGLNSLPVGTESGLVTWTRLPSANWTSHCNSLPIFWLRRDTHVTSTSAPSVEWFVLMGSCDLNFSRSQEWIGLVCVCVCVVNLLICMVREHKLTNNRKHYKISPNIRSLCNSVPKWWHGDRTSATVASKERGWFMLLGGCLCDAVVYLIPYNEFYTNPPFPVVELNSEPLLATSPAW